MQHDEVFAPLFDNGGREEDFGLNDEIVEPCKFCSPRWYDGGLDLFRWCPRLSFVSLQTAMGKRTICKHQGHRDDVK
jgi:hypothetical protein